ncbi:MAG: histidine kinase [Blautia sp.]|nr:histidine kinase [Blautia sp.]
MRKRLRFQTVRGRMIAGYAGVFLVIILLLNMITYYMTVRILTERNKETYEKVLTAAEEVLTDKLSIFASNARLIMENETVQKVLSMEEDTQGMYMGVERRNRLQAVSRTFTNSISDLGGIYLFDNSGKLFYQDPFRTSIEVEDQVHYEEIEKEDWFEAGVGAKGKEIFYGKDLLYGSDTMFSCVKVINELNTTRKIGLMVMTIRKEALRSVIGTLPVEKDEYLLLNDEDLVYRTGDPVTEEEIPYAQLLETGKKNLTITVHVCKDDRWRIAHLVENRYLFADAGTLRRMIISLAVFASVLMLITSILQASWITRPLQEFKEDIARVGQGEREFTHTYEDDEIGRIGQEFQRMVVDKLELQERVAKESLLRKESELQLLQSQINPHFLYNTLETLYWMAMAEDAEDVADLTQSLSEIFKISLNNGEEFISVRDEIRFIEDYLHIQNVRFEDKFLVRILVDEEIQDRKIPKQILQPFVENAIYHGLEPKLEKGNLTITGTCREGMLIFTVADDGAGIDPGTDVTKGYAVSNVIQRVALYYGEQAEVRFESEPGQGTTVTIVLPDEKETLRG